MVETKNNEKSRVQGHAEVQCTVIKKRSVATLFEETAKEQKLGAQLSMSRNAAQLPVRNKRKELCVCRLL